MFLPLKSYTDSDIYTALGSVREEHSPKSIPKVAKSREEDRLASKNGEDADDAAGKQLYEANGRVWALKRRLLNSPKTPRQSAHLYQISHEVHLWRLQVRRHATPPHQPHPCQLIFRNGRWRRLTLRRKRLIGKRKLPELVKTSLIKEERVSSPRIALNEPSLLAVTQL